MCHHRGRLAYTILLKVWLKKLRELSCLQILDMLWFGLVSSNKITRYTPLNPQCLMLRPQVDLLGIWFTQTLGALVTICAAIHCFQPGTKLGLLLAYLAVCLVCLYQAMTVSTVWGRRSGS